jgi:drug/metabolite transporter (DMT)-like permease
VKDCEVILEPCILCACPWAPRGLVLAAIAQVFFSVMILCVKLLRDRVPTFEIILVRQVLVYLISLAQIVLVLKRNPFGAPKDRKLLAVRGLCGFGGLSTAFYGIAKLPLTVSTLISFLNPIWSSLVAYCILHEKLSARDVAGGLIALSGTVWITHPAIIFGTAEASPPLNPFGLLASFTSGWFAAFAMVAVRQLRHESAVVLVHWFAGASVICSPLFLWIQSYETPPVMPRWTDEFLILLAITITGYIGQVLMNRAVQLEKAGRAMSMGYLQIVFAFVESATIFGVPPFWWEYVGTAFVVSGSAS